MKEVLLEVQPRVNVSKGQLSSNRNAGKIPAVFYGKDVKTASITIDEKSFLTIVEENGSNVLVTLNFVEGKKAAIIKHIQRDVISQKPIHIDFQNVSLTDKVEVLVPIHIEGVSDGVKNFGGVMETIVREIRVSCLPGDIPQKVTVDVSPLGIGQRVLVSDLPKLDGVEYLSDPNSLIVHIVTVSAEEEKSADAEGAAEPEVISKGKKDKEGEEGAAPAAGAGTQAGDKK
ncbi:MAG: 50S ribosomal protein L25 [Elusimicrobiota bacterium]|jgi:large subunit ribosomal protein L25|nr:50S ribosomal protein L25 [Elusimicrobiota bacterium]